MCPTASLPLPLRTDHLSPFRPGASRSRGERPFRRVGMALAVFVAAMELVAFVPSFQTHAGPASALVSSLDATGAAALEDAARSLATGSGPALGGALNCTLSADSLSGTCLGAGAASTPATGLGPAAITTSSPHWQSVIQPAARTLGATAYDVKDGYVLLFGGTNGTTYFADTWEFLHGKWIPLDPLSSPSARAGASMTYDKKDGYVVLFGGRGASGELLNDTWTFQGNSWTPLTTAVAPSPRADAPMTWDSHDGYTVLFGGTGASSTFSDTWKFVGGIWTRLLPPTGSLLWLPGASNPAGREDAAIVFDNLDNTVVMYGGRNVSASGSVFLGDTWEFGRGAWTQVSPAKPPSARAESSFAYDSKDSSVVLFGGYGTGGELNDTWTFASGNWSTSVPTPAPSPRHGAAGVWDLADLYFVIFSGTQGGSANSAPDTWSFVHGNWTQDKATPKFAGPEPSPRWAAAMAWDASDGYVVLFGGQSAAGMNGETWEFTRQSWIELFPKTSPSARAFAQIAYDAKDLSVILFGGIGTTGSALGDTWSFAAGAWTQLSLTTAPVARYGGQMVFDAADNYVLLFGGVGSSGTDLGDSWSFAGGHWTFLTTKGSPGPRGFPMMTYEARDGYAVLYGGFQGSRLLGDTWKYANGTWTNLTKAFAPTPRWGSVFVWSPLNHITLLFGGCEQAVNPLLVSCNKITDESWRLTNSTWGLLSKVPSPPGVVGAAAAFDPTKVDNLLLIESGLLNQSGEKFSPERWAYTGIYVLWFPALYPSAREGAYSIYELRDGKIVLFGGLGGSVGNGGTYLNDTWLWDTYVWVPADPRNSPSARAFGSEAADMTDNYALLFGGYGPTGYLGDTWRWAGGAVTGNWHRVLSNASPSARANESLTWDAKSGAVLLFGGQNSTAVFGDTWEYLGGQWTQLHPKTSPAAREGMALAYDSTDGYTVLFGGRDPFTNTTFSDTWKFSGGNWTRLAIATAPPARYGATVSDDPQDLSVLVFGGINASGRYLGDTWLFGHGAWKQISPGGTPPPGAEAFGAAGNDVDDGNIMMLGGFNGNYLAGWWTFF